MLGCQGDRENDEEAPVTPSPNGLLHAAVAGRAALGAVAGVAVDELLEAGVGNLVQAELGAPGGGDDQVVQVR